MFNGNLAVLGTAALFMALSSMQLWGSTPTEPPDTYEVNYFLGLHAPSSSGNDATITILNPGTNGSGNLCADIYVLNPSEELEACCGCLLSADEIFSGSVVSNLLSNNVSPITLANGVIKIISSTPAGGVCNAAKPTPTAAMRAWLTRLDSTGTSSGVTTTPFAAATLSSAEQSSLSTRCGDIQLVGSTFGICICPAEPNNAVGP